MCVVSMIMDHYDDKWFKDGLFPLLPIHTDSVDKTPTLFIVPKITAEEVEEFRALLERAREYDKKNNEPDCEIESKKTRIRQLLTDLAKEIDIDIGFLDEKK